jgi:hypothetical protein
MMLELCQEYDRITQRFEAWWAHSLLDRPIFLASANTRPERPIDRRLDLISQPERWFEAKYQDMLLRRRRGDMLPNIRIDFGPCLLASVFGGERRFEADTAWTVECIDDQWSKVNWEFSPGHPWWVRMRNLLEMVSVSAAGRYAVCSPNLGGSADILLILRGATKLCMDLVDQPEKIEQAVAAIYPGWLQAFQDLYRVTAASGAELIHWLYLWSARPYVITECDFCYMIGKKAFEHFFLPDIARQAAAAGRAVYHLDGPGCVRHLDALLALPELDAIQFTPGVENPSALAWVEMFRKIQAKGKSLLVICPAEEVLALAHQLSPEGLAILIESPLTPEELDDLYHQFCKKYAVPK